MYVPNPQMRFGISATPPRKNWAKSTAAHACYIKLGNRIFGKTAELAYLLPTYILTYYCIYICSLNFCIAYLIFHTYTIVNIYFYFGISA